MAHADGGLRMAELGLGGQAQVPGRNLRVLAIQPWVFNPLKWEPAYCEARGARRSPAPVHTAGPLESPASSCDVRICVSGLPRSSQRLPSCPLPPALCRCP